MDGLINSVNTSLSKLGEIVKDSEDRHAVVHGVAKSDMTEQLNNSKFYSIISKLKFN